MHVVVTFSPVVLLTIVAGAMKIWAESRKDSLSIIVPMPPKPLTTESMPQEPSLQ